MSTAPAAINAVPREEFVSTELVEFAYSDTPLPIAASQTISQPYIVALMTAALELKPTDRVLEVGTGSGYAAAILAEIAAQVYTIERHRILADSARNKLEELGYDNIRVLHGDGSLGWREHAPDVCRGCLGNRRSVSFAACRSWMIPTIWQVSFPWATSAETAAAS